MHYRLNEPDVIQETVEREVLIIHTPSGTYYSLQGTGEFVWNALLAGHAPREIARAHVADGDAAVELTEAVERFVQELQREELLLPGDPPTDATTLSPPPIPFSAPVLQKYTDMQDLLLVDPIHQVDPDAGWPTQQ